jgi:NAD(P)-dependent dehydrogenase (short-subunit alcohol dehydrogenase family)
VSESAPLAGRVAVVTGGARGMGRAHCELLSERGASIVLCDLDGDVAQEAAAAIVAAGGRAVAASTDVGDRAQCEALVALAVETFGGIDVLVHNAGRLPCGARLEDTDDAVWHALFAVNAHGPMYLTRAALPHLRRSRAPRVIFISSQWGQVGPGHSHAYIASKTAMIGLAKNLALELAPEGILVNAVAPGAVRTRMVPPENEAEEIALIPIGRLGEPRELSYTVAFLASDEAAFVTGQVFAINGGALVVGI